LLGQQAKDMCGAGTAEFFKKINGAVWFANKACEHKRSIRTTILVFAHF